MNKVTFSLSVNTALLACVSPTACYTSQAFRFCFYLNFSHAFLFELRSEWNFRCYVIDSRAFRSLVDELRRVRSALCGKWSEFMPFIATSPTGHCPWPKVNKFRLWKTPQFWNNGLGPHEWSARGIKVYWIIPERLWHVRKGKLKIIYDPFIALSLCLFKPFSPIMDPCINAKRFLILCQHKAS